MTASAINFNLALTSLAWSVYTVLRRFIPLNCLHLFYLTLYAYIMRSLLLITALWVLHKIPSIWVLISRHKYSIIPPYINNSIFIFKRCALWLFVFFLILPERYAFLFDHTLFLKLTFLNHCARVEHKVFPFVLLYTVNCLFHTLVYFLYISL